MTQISIICADDASEWGQFLAKEICELGNIIQFIVDEANPSLYTKMNQDVNCIIFSPDMLKKKTSFIQQSRSFLKNPIIVLCGVSELSMTKTVVCKPWQQCQTLVVTSSRESSTRFYKAVEKRLIDQRKVQAAVVDTPKSRPVTLIPDTIVQKANQSCVLILPRPFGDEVKVSIKGCLKLLVAKQKDTLTYVFNVPELPEGEHQLNIYASKRLIATRISLTVINPTPPKCSCDYIYKILDSDDLHPLDETLTSSMRSDYSNMSYHQNISEPNPDCPEFPTVLHFAARHGMRNVIRQLMEFSNGSKGAKIKNNKNMDCLDIAKRSKFSSTLVPFLEEMFNEDQYIDMTQNNSYMDLAKLRLD